MIANPFYLLNGVANNSAMCHRQTGMLNKHGVYFWGFSLKDDFSLPVKSDELVIWYIGKDQKNIGQRMMQEITQLIFGGFGSIYKPSWLKANPYTARLLNKQQNPADTDIIYRADGLHVLPHFLNDPTINSALNWMKERLIFTWIDLDDLVNLATVESELHHIVRTNIFGTGGITNLHPKKVVNTAQTTLFSTAINWGANKVLQEWLIEVNNAI